MEMDELIRRCQLGEKEAFRELFTGIENKALGTAYLISGSRGIAEDIVQEAYITCFKEIEKIKNVKTFQVWFYKTLIRTGWKMAKKHSKLIPSDMMSEGEHDYYEMHSSYESSQIRQEIREAVGKLSKNLRTVMILYYFNDMSVEEIAKVTGSLKATVKTRLYYGRHALKRELSGLIEERSMNYQVHPAKD
ncbi:MAG: RNA polymerase sigma factor [Clostridia bacterium]|nr:RNA polymerase sigma factor [Clostridia bacterium]